MQIWWPGSPTRLRCAAALPVVSRLAFGPQGWWVL